MQLHGGVGMRTSTPGRAEVAYGYYSGTDIDDLADLLTAQVHGGSRRLNGFGAAIVRITIVVASRLLHFRRFRLSLNHLGVGAIGTTH